jgi:hypothetical protein
MKVLDLHCRSEHVFEGWLRQKKTSNPSLAKGWFSALCVGMTRYKNASALRA